MEDLEQIIYPWGIYNTADIESEFIDPYITAIIKVLNWSGESVYRYWSMLFGINGWVTTGEEWIVQWETDFQASFKESKNQRQLTIKMSMFAKLEFLDHFIISIIILFSKKSKI
jgi:hypothetical protein